MVASIGRTAAGRFRRDHLLARPGAARNRIAPQGPPDRRSSGTHGGGRFHRRREAGITGAPNGDDLVVMGGQILTREAGAEAWAKNERVFALDLGTMRWVERA